jgi:hypothetical protein
MPNLDEVMDAMVKGITSNGAILCTVLPRVASEIVVVGAAADGILQRWPNAKIYIEKGKRDLGVVLDGSPCEFEFKTVWPGGGSPVEDLCGKLAGKPECVAVTFAYVVQSCERATKEEHPFFRPKPDFDAWTATLRRSVETTRIGEALVASLLFESNTFRIADHHGCDVYAKLMAWRPLLPSPDAS